MCVTDLMQPTTNSCNVSNQNFKSMPKQPNWHAIAFAIIQFKCLCILVREENDKVCRISAFSFNILHSIHKSSRKIIGKWKQYLLGSRVKNKL